MPPSFRRIASHPLSLAAVLVVAVVAAYSFSLRGEFLWDDDLHITDNPTIIGPLGLKEIWSTARANYFPLVLTNFWVQHALWGLEPFGYRVVTLLFHAAAAVLLWRVLLQLRIPGAWLGAALWALHPVQVESVAWICELKNTQSAVFFLAALGCYVRWLEDRRERWPYALALFCAILALLSKPSTVMLPVALALCAWWVRRRVEWRDLVPLAPFFALSAFVAGWTVWEQKYHSGALGPEWNQTLAERFVIAGRVIWFYLGKLAWPEPLIFIYPRWPIAAGSLLAFAPLAAVVAGLVALWRFRFRGPALAGGFFAAAFFVALLFPVLGFFNVYFFRYSFVGDHFQYLASMGPLALAGAALARKFHTLLAGEATECSENCHAVGGRRDFRADVKTAWRFCFSPHELKATAKTLTHRASGRREDQSECEKCGLAQVARLPVVRNGADGAASSREVNIGGWRAVVAGFASWVVVGLVLVLGVLTWRESTEYLNSETLWRATLARNPRAIMAWLNLGGTLVQNGKTDQAIATFTHVTRVKPDDVDAYNDLGGALLLIGRRAEALVALERAVALAPRRAEVHNNLGNAQRSLGRTTEAMASYRRALELDPAYAAAHDNLGAELAEAGQMPEAIECFRTALRIAPKSASALNNLGNALRTLGRLDEAMARHREALALKPDFADALAGVGYDLVLSGRAAEGLPQLQRAVKMSPNHSGIRGYLGRTLALLGRTDEALTQFARAVELAPQSAEAHNNLGSALAQRGRGAEAVAEFGQAVQLAPRFAGARLNFGNALLAASRWAEAATQFEEAVMLRPDEAEGHARLAVAQVNAGRLEEAVAPFETALRLRPDVAEVHDHFAQVLRSLGRNREALEHFERAAELRRPRR